MENLVTTSNKSTKSGWIALFLGIFLGIVGIHRFFNNAPSTSVTPSDAYLQYQDEKAKFSILYPAAWDINSKKPGHLFATGKKGTASFHSIITIYTIPTKKMGGKFSSVKAYVEAFKKEMTQQFSTVKFLNEGEAELPQNPKQFHGEYIMFTFTHKNIAFKRMDFIIGREDGLALYDWSYTAPEKRFDQDLPIAKVMYESLVIK